MKHLKTLAGITALSLAASVFTLIPSQETVVEAASVTCGFEGDTDGWAGRGDAVAEVVTTKAHSGDSSLFVSGRTQFWNGCFTENEILHAGGSYHISGYICYSDPSAWQQKFSFNLQYTQGEETYPTVAEDTAHSDEWKFFEGDIMIPTDAKDISLYVQTAYSPNPTEQDLMDFYLDDVTIEEVAGPEIEHDLTGLKEYYGQYFKFGTAMMGSEVGIQAIDDLMDKHFNSLTFGNELKPDFVLDQQATLAYVKENGDQTNPQISLKNADKLLKYCAERNIPVRGHCLVWHSQTPDWFFKENFSNDGDWVSKEVMIQRMENYIKNVMEALATQYPEVEFYAWDVVNEAFTDAGKPREAGSNNVTEGNSAWVKVFGDNSFIEYAFKFARQYAPKGCKLFYNDYNEYVDAKCDAISEMAKDLSEKGLLDGIGMQSHLDMSYPTAWDYERALKKYAALGVELQVTELDITTSDKSETGLKEQAKRYREILDSIVSVKKDGANVSAVVVWGMSDANSWRGDRVPLIFDGDFKAKPAYYSLIEGLEAVPQHQPAGTKPSETTAPPEVTEPQVSETTPDPSNTPAVMYGDIDASTTVDLTDLTLLSQYLLRDIKFTADQLKVADVMYDEEINTSDLALLKQFVMNDEVTLGPVK